MVLNYWVNPSVAFSSLHDSMQMDSGITLAELKVNSVEVSLRVCGDVRVVYKDDVYRGAKDMPEELLDKFASGTAYNDPDIVIDMNNWFETFIYIDGVYAGGDVVDVDGETEWSLLTSLYDICLSVN